MALKVGTENKRNVYIASALGAVMLFMLVRFLWQTFGPSTRRLRSAPPAPVVVTPCAISTRARLSLPLRRDTWPTKVGGLAALDPTLHPETHAAGGVA